MPPDKKFSRINILDIKERIFRKLGRGRAEKYFFYLNRLLDLKTNKHEFGRMCINIIGRENIPLHNLFVSSILKNAALSLTPPVKPTRIQRVSSDITNKNENVRKVRGRSSGIHSKVTERPSPLGTPGRTQESLQDQSTPSSLEDGLTTMISQKKQEPHCMRQIMTAGSKALLGGASVEEGEEVDQHTRSPGIQSRSPIRPPLGIHTSVHGVSKMVCSKFLSSPVPETCYSSSQLPNLGSLRMCLEHKLKMKGFEISPDSVNLLNHGLDAYLKTLLKPCVELVGARNGNILNNVNVMRRTNQGMSVSLLDFQLAMQTNPHLLGENWPIMLEKLCMNSSHY